MKIILSIALSIMAFNANAQTGVQRIDSLLNEMYANKTINGNVLIAEKGHVIYKRSFGFANELTHEKLDDNSIFELASVSKQFTAMGIAILAKKGQLRLDDKLSKYIPGLSFYGNVTINNLLHHTGGLPDYIGLMDSLFDKSKIATNKDVINIFTAQKPKALFEPNTKWEYSNTGYALLASVIEKVSGMSYGRYLKKEIFDPLGMTNTFVYTRRYAPRKLKNYAFGYVFSDSLKKYVLPDELKETSMVIWLDGIVGDGTVNSTVNDLLKWDRALYTDKLLSKKGMDQLFAVDTLNSGSSTNYGMGWFIETSPDFGKLTSHSGGWPGYRTFIDRHIDNDKTIIILQNHDDVVNPIRSIRAILYNKPLATKEKRKEITLPADQLKKFPGTYELREGLEMKISLDGNQLLAQLTNQNAFPIFAETETNFFFKIVDAQLQFHKNENGEIGSVTLLQNGNKIDAKRIK